VSGRAKPNERWVLALSAVLLLAVNSVGAPGGYLVEGISDECETFNPIWSAGLRGMPEFITVQGGTLSIRSVDNGDDSYPSAEDMVSTYAQRLEGPVRRTEGPSITAWIWMPPFEEWPAGVNASGAREWFGVRVTAYDPELPNGTGLYFPGIYIAADEAGPILVARVGDGYAPDVTIARVTSAGWWTFGLAWNAQGVTEYYAAPGRVTLTDGDRLHVTPTFDESTANRSLYELAGNFIALRMTYPPTGQLSPDWRMDNFRVYVQTPPDLPQLGVHRDHEQMITDVAGGSQGFRYLLQRSTDLSEWETIADFISDGEAREFGAGAAVRGFYRVARP
jgi:hypothetical protein